MMDRLGDVVLSFTSEDILNMRVSYGLLLQKLEERSMDLHSFCLEVGLTPDMEDLIRHQEMISLTAMGKVRDYFSCHTFDLIELISPEDADCEFKDAP